MTADKPAPPVITIFRFAMILLFYSKCGFPVPFNSSTTFSKY